MKKKPNGGFDKLTPRARQVLMLAKRESMRFNHGYVGTEHLLLGLLALGDGVAVNVLQERGVNLDALRLEVEKSCGQGDSTIQDGELALTAGLSKVLNVAAAEAQAMNYNFIGTEHLLLGILGEGGSQAARIIRNLGVDSEQVRRAVLKALDPDYLPESTSADNSGESSSGSMPRYNGNFTALEAFGRNLTELAAIEVSNTGGCAAACADRAAVGTQRSNAGL